MAMIAVAQYTIRDATDITASAVAPATPAENELWLDTSVSPNQLKRYTGATWVVVNDPAALEAAVEAAQSTAEAAMTDVDALRKAGRNLIWGTLAPSVAAKDRPRICGSRLSDGSGSVANYKPDNTNLTVAEHGIRVTSNSASRPCLVLGNPVLAQALLEPDPLYGLEPGQPYTLSGDLTFLIYSGNLTLESYFRVGLYYAFSGDTAWHDAGRIARPKAENGVVCSSRMEATFTIPEGVVAWYILLGPSNTLAANSAAGDFVELRHMKLEIGSIATAWSPAPEDTAEGLQRMDQMQIGGRNLIWGTLNPQLDVGTRPAVNGLHATETNPAGEITCSSGTLEAIEHGLMVMNTAAARTFFRLGSSDPATGSLLGLIPGETYTLSADVEYKLLSGTQTASTYGTYIFMYHDAANNGTFAIGNVADNTAYSLGEYPKALKGTVMAKRVEWTFIIPSGATMVYFMIANSRPTVSNYAAGDYIALSNLKLEKGHRATDWTAAPEDTEEVVETKLASVHARISNEGEAIRQEVQATYALASDMNRVTERVSTLSEQSESNYTWAVTRINQLQQDLTNAHEATEDELAVFRTYMSFDEDGLSIGKTGNPFTFRVVNDRLAFYMNDTEVAYLSNNKLYVTQAEILTKLIIGKFAFEPQSNGNLSLIYNG